MNAGEEAHDALLRLRNALITARDRAGPMDKTLLRKAVHNLEGVRGQLAEILDSRAVWDALEKLGDDAPEA